MAPREFIEKGRDNPLKERASYQLHFIDLCSLDLVALSMGSNEFHPHNSNLLLHLND